MSSEADWPGSWLGSWVAPDGKVVTIERDGDVVTVTVRPGAGRAPYTSATLLDGSTKPIDRLAAACEVDQSGKRYLEVQAGTVDLGPTYQLHPAVETPPGWRAADVDAPTDQVRLLPNTSIGLYDDYEDDQGVCGGRIRCFR